MNPSITGERERAGDRERRRKRKKGRRRCEDENWGDQLLTPSSRVLLGASAGRGTPYSGLLEPPAS